MTIIGKMNKQLATMQKNISSEAEQAVVDVFNKAFADRISDIEANSQDVKQLQQDYTTLRALCDEYERRIRILELRKGQKPTHQQEVLGDKPAQDDRRKGRNNPDPFNKKMKN